ncbi:polo-like kinase 3 [Mortierella sp. AD031]|nr:polo-like kinase 3 [Mortierella sp. AD031]
MMGETYREEGLLGDLNRARVGSSRESASQPSPKRRPLSAAIHVGGTTCLLFELCAQEDLWNILEARRRLKEHEARYFGRQLAASLVHLHQLGLAHCDIKPENLFLTEDLVLRIGDLGLAEDLEGGGVFKRRTGTRGYRAPEIEAHRRHTLTLDVWSVGCVLYKMLEGRSFNTKWKKAGKKGKDPWENIKVSKEAEDLVRHALDPNPKTRITAREMAGHHFLTTGYCPDRLTWEILEKAAANPYEVQTETETSTKRGAREAACSSPQTTTAPKKKKRRDHTLLESVRTVSELPEEEEKRGAEKARLEEEARLAEEMAFDEDLL